MKIRKGLFLCEIFMITFVWFLIISLSSSKPTIQHSSNKPSFSIFPTPASSFDHITQSSTITPSKNCQIINPITFSLPTPFFYWEDSDFNPLGAKLFFDRNCISVAQLNRYSSFIPFEKLSSELSKPTTSSNVAEFFLIDDFSLFKLWRQNFTNFQLISQLVSGGSDLVIMSKREKSIVSIGDLRGRRVAVCVPHVKYFEYELKREGMNLNQVVIEELTDCDSMYLKVLDESIDAYFVNDRYVFTQVRKSTTVLYYPREFNIIESSFNNSTIDGNLRRNFRYGIIVKENPNISGMDSIIKRFLMSQTQIYSHCRDHPVDCFEKWIVYDYMITELNNMIWPAESGFGFINESSLINSMEIYLNATPTTAQVQDFLSNIVNGTIISQIVKECNLENQCINLLDNSPLNITGLNYTVMVPTFCEDYIFPYPLSCQRYYLYYRLYCSFVPFLIGALLNFIFALIVPWLRGEHLMKHRFIAPFVTPICFTGFLLFSAILFCRFVYLPEHVAYGLASACIVTVIITRAMNVIRYFYVRNLFKLMKKKRNKDKKNNSTSNMSIKSTMEKEEKSTDSNLSFHRMVTSKLVFTIVWIVLVVLIPPSFFVAQYFSPANYIIRNGLQLLVYVCTTICMVMLFIFDTIVNRKRLKKRGFISFMLFDDPLLYRLELLLCIFELLSILWISLSDYYVYNMAAFTAQAVGFLALGIAGSITWSYGFAAVVILYRKLKKFLVSKLKKKSKYGAMPNHLSVELSGSAIKSDYLEKLMENDDFYSLLDDYCKKEFSSENLFLYNILRQYRKRNELYLSDLLFIFNNYVKNYAPFEVNVSSTTKKVIREILFVNSMIESTSTKDRFSKRITQFPSEIFPNYESFTTPYQPFDETNASPPSSKKAAAVPPSFNQTQSPMMGRFKDSFRKLSSLSEGDANASDDLVGDDAIDRPRRSTVGNGPIISFETIQCLYNDVTQNVMDTFSRLCETNEYQQWESLNNMTNFISNREVA